MYRILIIGAGQIGSRHLQGLMTMESEIEIGVIDPAAGSLDVARDRAQQAGIPANVKKIFYGHSIEDISFDKTDLAIIATNADTRADVIKKLLDKQTVSNMLLEKVVFQSEKEFEEISRLLESNKTGVWVNTPRRIYTFYNKLREAVRDEPGVDIVVTGSGWGLACNMVHYLDLFAYLSGSEEIRADFTHLEKRIIESKRKGFYEANGSLGFSSDSGSLRLICTANGSPGTIIQISSGDMDWIISEAAGMVISLRRKAPVHDALKGIQLPYQSQLTGIVAEEILKTGSCGLPGLEESYRLHRMFLPVLRNHFSELLGQELTACPIT